tara:strand:+ start:3497 stop:4258 length:762 start_codon:yes stop_codon:yes gene_type:complete
MKIVGFCQLHNELEKGNLENWFTSMRFCDYIYIYDQNSEDGSKEYYKKYPNVRVIQSDTNNFENEIKCKSLLLETLLKEHPDTDWIFWMDGDTILESGANRTSIEYLLKKADERELDGLSLGHYNLWRSDVHYRIDNEYHWLHNNGVLAFWKNNGNISFPRTAGLHQNQFPDGMNNVGRVQNLSLIHRGFSTDEQITTRYHIYKNRGQSGWSLDRLLDEKTLKVMRLSDDLLPGWFNIKNDIDPCLLEKIKND